MRILVVSYFFPPLGSVGAFRTSGFVRNLHEMGLEITVLTVSHPRDSWVIAGTEPVPDGVEVVRCREWPLVPLAYRFQSLVSGVARLGLLGPDVPHVRDWLLDPDAQIAWDMTRALRSRAPLHDVVYVSCSPFSAALRVVREIGAGSVPIVVDFRDPWSLNQHVHVSPGKRERARRAEQEVMSAASEVILNTPGALAAYADAYPERASRLSVIPNGYDELLPAVQDDGNEWFDVVHVGSFYGGRSPRRVLEAIASTGIDRMRFVQVGGEHPEMRAWANRDQVVATGQLPRAQAIERMRRASVLYLAQSRDTGAAYDMAVAAKTYEYLATGLPVIADCGRGDNLELIRGYASTAYVPDDDSVEALAATLRRAWAERDRVTPRVLPAYADEYSRRALTERLLKVLERACGGGAGSAYLSLGEIRAGQDALDGERGGSADPLLKRALVGVSTRFPAAPLLDRFMLQSPLVLMFHRFRSSEENVRGHDPQLVEAALQFVRDRDFDVLPLGDLVRELEQGRPFERKVLSITVDDGYWDQAEIGAELFRRYDCPATFFVSTGFQDGDLWLWDSKVEYIIRHGRHEVVELEQPVRLRLRLAATGRTAVSRQVIRLLTGIDALLLDEVIHQLAAACEVEVPREPPHQFAPMGWDMARRLEAMGMSIAPHSVTHRLLARLPETEARQEVVTSWKRVSEEVGNPLPVFGYPSGRRQDFGSRDECLVRESGLLAAVSAEPGFVRARGFEEVRFRIPRIGMPGTFGDFVQCVSGLELAKERIGWARLRREGNARHV